MEDIDEKWTLTNPHHSVTMYSWRMLGVNENRMNELSKKIQRSVSLSSTETEIISLDAGLGLDLIPALDLWDLIVAILHGNHVSCSTSQTSNGKEKSWKD